MKRIGRILLLDCGHHAVLRRDVQATCHQCETGDTDPGDAYLAGYRAGLSSQVKITTEDMERLGGMWLNVAVDRLDHTDGCQCQACVIARKLIHVANDAMNMRLDPIDVEDEYE